MTVNGGCFFLFLVLCSTRVIDTNAQTCPHSRRASAASLSGSSVLCTGKNRNRNEGTSAGRRETENCLSVDFRRKWHRETFFFLSSFFSSSCPSFLLRCYIFSLYLYFHPQFQPLCNISASFSYDVIECYVMAS